MLKEFAQYLVSLKDNKTYTIHGDTYSDRELVRIDPHVDRPRQISVSGLDSIVKLLRNELDMFDNLPMFVRVDGARKVSVFSTYDSEMCRDSLYEATCDVPGFQEGFREQEKAIIELRSKFMPGEGVDYLLDLLSRINKENGVTTRDNGVSQEVEARQGISLKALVQVKPRISMRPYSSIKRMKRRIRLWEEQYAAGEITREKIMECYGSWEAHAKHGDTRQLRQEMRARLEASLARAEKRRRASGEPPPAPGIIERRTRRYGTVTFQSGSGKPAEAQRKHQAHQVHQAGQ